VSSFRNIPIQYFYIKLELSHLNIGKPSFFIVIQYFQLHVYFQFKFACAGFVRLNTVHTINNTVLDPKVF